MARFWPLPRSVMVFGPPKYTPPVSSRTIMMSSLRPPRASGSVVRQARGSTPQAADWRTGWHREGDHGLRASTGYVPVVRATLLHGVRGFGKRPTSSGASACRDRRQLDSKEDLAAFTE